MVNAPIGLAEYQNDHDVLVELRTEFRGMRIDIKALTETTGQRVADHEARLRIIESAVAIIAVEKRDSDRYTRIGGAMLIFIVGIAEFIIMYLTR